MVIIFLENLVSVESRKKGTHVSVLVEDLEEEDVWAGVAFLAEIMRWRKLIRNPTIIIIPFSISGTRRRSTHQTLTKLYKSSSTHSYSTPTEEEEEEGRDRREPVPILYSFLRPTLFSIPTIPSPPPPPPPPTTLSSIQTPDDTTIANLQSSLLSSIHASDTDEAWKYFKILTSCFPRSPPVPSDVYSALVSHLCSFNDLHNLKRAYTSAIFLLDKHPASISFQSLQTLFSALHNADTPAPAFALVKSMFKNRIFPPFSVWGEAAVALVKRKRQGCGGGSIAKDFVEVFEDNCRIASEEGIRAMVPDLRTFHVVMDVYCRQLGSVSGAKKIVETMSTLGLTPDIEIFGAMAYLFSWKGMQSRILELQELVSVLGFTDKTLVYENLIRGYVKSGDLKSVSSVFTKSLQEGIGKGEEGGCESWKGFGGGTYEEVVKCFVSANGGVKELASLIMESQQLESDKLSTGVECTVGFGIVNACVHIGMLDKAHSVLDEMNSCGVSAGIGVYSSILKAYCKERRTAEAAQLVTQIGATGLKLDSGSYDALIDASMSVQDFQSAFSLFRDMREASLHDLKISYITIMTGLMENQRPELMAGFLDSVVDDPGIEVATHDWNSIIHAFCKAGRLEDARRTYRRMLFLQFEPNEQTYLSLINGYVSSEKYFSVLILWTEIKKKKTSKFDNALIDAFLYALVKGGFFDAAMEVVEKAQELKLFIDKWRYKQAFMETHKKLKVAKLRRRSIKKMGSLVAFKNWAGLGA